MSEWEEMEEWTHGRTRVRKSVPEHAKESRLGFETNPPNTLFEGSTLSLFLKKIALLDWNDG